MMKFIRDLKQIWIARKIEAALLSTDDVQTKLDKMLIRFKDDVDHILEEKSFAYIKDVNDSKSDYLKRYLETNIRCINDKVVLLANMIAEMRIASDASAKEKTKNARKKHEPKI